VFPLDRSKIPNEQLVGKGNAAEGDNPTPPENAACVTCGAKKNPLVTHGLVSESLQHILIPPNVPEKKINCEVMCHLPHS